MTLDWTWAPNRIPKRAARESLAALSRIGGEYASVPPFNDEPKVINLTTVFPGDLESRGLGRASGSSLDFDRAATKVFGEAVERLSAVPGPETTSTAPRPFAALSESALDPELLNFSCRGTRPGRDHPVRWVTANKVFHRSQEASLVPAQLVHLPYELPDEPIWWLSSSNGLAAGSTVEHAVFSGLLELVEREALMYFWEHPESAQMIDKADLATSGPMDTLVELAGRYALRPHLLRLHTPYESTHTLLCYLEDLTGAVPHGSIGLKAGGEIGAAMLGALEESIQIRPWLRELALTSTHPPDVLRTIDDRALWWITPDTRQEMFARMGSVAPARSLETRPTKYDLGTLIEDVSQVRGPIWVAPLPSVAPELAVTRVVVPAIAPIYFDETYGIRSTSPHAYAVHSRHPLL